MKDRAWDGSDTDHFTQSSWINDAVTVAVCSVGWIALWNLAEILAVTSGISAWYPPAAVSLFLLIRYGAPAAVVVFGASLVAGSAQWAPYPGHHELLGSAGHTVAYLVASQVYRRNLQSDRYSIRPRSIVLLVLAAIVGASISSALGNLNVFWAYAGEVGLDFVSLFSWAIGDFFGVISLCPVMLFVGCQIRWSPGIARRVVSILKTPVMALVIAIGLASAFAVIAGGSDLSFRLLSVVGVGVYSVLVAYVASPRSAVIYLFLVAAMSAAWLSTEMVPTARIEFAVQISTFLTASLAMLVLSMDRMKERVAATNRRLRIHELSEQRDALSQRISAVETEFVQLAHEFKTPLGGIIGLLDVAETGMASGDRTDDIARHLKYMRGCAWYLNAMVDDAFDVARIARGRFEPVITEFDVRDLLDDLAVIAQAKVGGGVRFRVDAAAQGLPVRSDRNRLLQILINLLVNAVRYADRRGSVSLTCVAMAGTVTITVENASSTLTKAQLDALIAGGHGLAENSKGLGIGLPLVGRLAMGIGAQLSTTVSGGIVSIAVTVPRA